MQENKGFLMERSSFVKLVAVCPHCGESVEIVMSKKEVKRMMKEFKMGIKEAQQHADAYHEQRYRKEMKSHDLK